ncbi:MAG TPA: tetratricopeptide repeat protein [Cyclobacteriaceae bacterium]|nr:tetratricopeptide repeat protein [Cyclobacteriaceae bacterium]
MAKSNTILYLKKAGPIACLFLFLFTPLFASNPVWKFDSQLQKAYQSVLNLEIDQAYSALKSLQPSTNPYHKIYVESFCETLDVLISEDEVKFQKIEANFRARFKYLDTQKESAETLFLKAELNLQRGFNFLNLGQDLNAVWAIRTAYSQTEECLKKYPDFIPIKKTSGVIQVMVGSVPDKYSWFMSLLGMKGSVSKGQEQLQDLRKSESSLNTEATILYFTIKGLINQQHEEATNGILKVLQDQPYNRLVLFLGVNMLMKNSQSEKALQLIRTLDEHPQGLPMYYIDYLKGEILLQKGDYTNAISAYQKFIVNYKSINFKKDAYYKISLCYWLQNKKEEAYKNFEIAKKTGKEVAEPDRYANSQLKESIFPNPKILKVRLYTDGGYYQEALSTLKAINESTLTTEKEKTEYSYRKARLADKMGDPTTAKIYYIRTMKLAGTNPWYFAPNAALQLGYIAKTSNDIPTAKKYFELALSYKNYAYKNSIDSKAKSALDQLNK